jgi:hypothetical protein
VGIGRPQSVIASGTSTPLEVYAWDAPNESGLLDYASSYYNGSEVRVDTTGYDLRA